MSELTQRIRAKYPGIYDDLSDADLEKAVLAKHPEYADLAGKEPTRSNVQIVGKAESDDPREQIQEPTTFWGGFGRSILQQMGVGNPESPLSRAAHPQDLGDIGSLLLPNAVDAAIGAGAALAPAMNKAGQVIREYANPAVARAIGEEIPGVNNIIRARDKVQRIVNLRRDPFPVGPTATPFGPAVAPDFDFLNVGPTRRPFGPALGATPTRIRGQLIVPSPSGATALEAAVPVAADLPQLDARITGLTPTAEAARPTFPNPMESTYARVLERRGGTGAPTAPELAATLPSPEVTDTARSWHSGVTDPAARQRMQAAHKVIMDEDARYRAATAAERTRFQAMPPSYRNALLSSFFGSQ